MRRSGLGSAQATGAPTRIGLRSRAQSAGQLTYASARPLFTFDPRLVQTTEEMGLMQHVCEPLVRLDAQMNLTPGLATAWEPVDVTTWKFTLQSGVTFSNGEPFDAEAVKFSMEEYQRTGEAYPWFDSGPVSCHRSKSSIPRRCSSVERHRSGPA